MLLKDLLTDLGQKFEVYADENLKIGGLCFDEREVKRNEAFFCLKGASVDGHNFAHSAHNKGASVVFAERLIDGVPCVVVENTRKAIACVARNFYNSPSKNFKLVGVTGTNGKTSTTYILANILQCAGKSVGIIGTNGIFYAGKSVEFGMTTPDPIFLQKVFADMRDNGIDVCVMEVSAHGLYWHKTFGTMFDIALFSNLSQDHLDFFIDMQNYANAKSLLFKKYQSKCAVINIDDEFGEMLAKQCKIPVSCVSKVCDANVQLKDMRVIEDKMRLNLLAGGNNFCVTTKLMGGFNASNILLAVGGAVTLDISQKDIVRGLETIEPVPGRFNCISLNGKGLAVIDYAHSPDGVENILTECRKLCSGKLICVFGCGGNRDRSKRKIMGEIATSLCDEVVITSDNPRFENPLDIINDIYVGAYANLDRCVCSKIVKRDEAIAFALSKAQVGDVVAILGKGVEDYLEIDGKKLPFSDYEEVNRFLKQI